MTRFQVVGRGKRRIVEKKLVGQVDGSCGGGELCSNICRHGRAREERKYRRLEGYEDCRHESLQYYDEDSQTDCLEYRHTGASN